MTIYRYEDEGYFSLDDVGASERRVALRCYTVIKETTKGVWIHISYTKKKKVNWILVYMVIER